MSTAKQHSYVINNCLKFGENLSLIDLTTAETLIAKNLIQNNGTLELQMLTHLQFPGQENRIILYHQST